MNGTIKKLLTDKRCGFIRGTDGIDYFFHESKLQKSISYDDLEAGQPATFEEADGPRGPYAEDVQLD